MCVCVCIIIYPLINAHTQRWAICRYGSTILHKKFQVISSKNEGVMAISTNFLSKFKVQGLDIATLLGAEGPQ